MVDSLQLKLIGIDSKCGGDFFAGGQMAKIKVKVFLFKRLYVVHQSLFMCTLDQILPFKI
jgi:hypothetical protein